MKNLLEKKERLTKELKELNELIEQYKQLPKEAQNLRIDFFDSFLTTKEDPIKVLDAFKDIIVPFALNDKNDFSYGYYDKDYIPKFPFYFYISKRETILKYTIFFNGKYMNVWNIIDTDKFKINYSVDYVGNGCNCRKVLTHCQLAYPQELLKDWTKQTWGSIEGEPYSYMLWLDKEPQDNNIDTIKQILKEIL